MPERPDTAESEFAESDGRTQDPNRTLSIDGQPIQTYRARFRVAATARNIPIAVILTSVLVAFAVLDANLLVLLLLWVLRRILLYCFVALFIALLLAPAIRALRRTGLSHGFSVVLVFSGSMVAFGGLLAWFTAPLVKAIPNFTADLRRLVKQAEHGKGHIGKLLANLHLQRWINQNAPKIAKDITRSLSSAHALSVGTAALSTIVAITTIAVLALFMLLAMPQLRVGLMGSLDPRRRDRFSRVYAEATRSVTLYMFGNALTSLAAGMVIFITLVIVGVPYPLLLGVWVALVDLLPLVGGLLAGVPVAIMALFQSVPAFIIVVIVLLTYQMIENHILNPMVMSRTVRLDPLWVLLAVLVGATLGDKVGGGLGAFAGGLLGIPLGGAAQVIWKEFRVKPPDNSDLEPSAAAEMAEVP